MTINEFFEIYNRYCDNTGDFLVFNNFEDVFEVARKKEDVKKPTAVGIYRQADNYFIDIDDFTFIEFENEAYCVYHFFEKFYQILESKGFPKCNILFYKDLTIGVVINFQEGQKAYLIDDVVADCNVPNLNDFQILNENFWSFCFKEIVDKTEDWIARI